MILTAFLAKSPLRAQEPKPEKDRLKQEIPGTGVSFELCLIPAGEFVLGSGDDEPGRETDEGPARRVKVDAFWMGRCEVTWDEYDLWYHDLDRKRREAKKVAADGNDVLADAVTRPTKPYTDMTFGMGHDGFPAICMTQLAARTYCEWLSAKTGHFYRLPTEAEWEYACRAGSKTAYSFGNDPKDLGDYAWFAENSNEKSQKVGQKKPNAFGLHDMHGNVMEWTLDQFKEDTYASYAADSLTINPFVPAPEVYPHSVRGGSWKDKARRLRSAARVASDPMWKMQDPQMPQSRWYFTDALFVGFRVVRAEKPPAEEERLRLR